MTEKNSKAESTNPAVQDLCERVHSLKQFDKAQEVNTYCDDLVSQVLLAVDSVVSQLYKFQDEMVEEVNSYRTGLLEKKQPASKQEQFDMELDKLSKKLEAVDLSLPVSAVCKEMPSDEDIDWSEPSRDFSSAEEAYSDRIKELRKRMRARAFESGFLKFKAKSLVSITKDMIGQFYMSRHDVEDFTEVQHIVLDDLAPRASSFVIGPSSFRESRLIDFISALLFLSDGNLAICVDHQPILIWSVECQQTLFELRKEDVDESITSMAQLPNEGHLVTATHNGNVYIWSLESKCKIKALQATHSSILSLKVLPNGNLVGLGESICIWDPSQQKETSLLREISIPNSFLGKANLEILTNGNLAGSFVDYEKVSIKVWNPDDGKVVKDREFVQSYIENCWILPDSSIVMASSCRTIKIYSLIDEKLCRTLSHRHGHVFTLKQLEDKSLLFVHLNDPKVPRLSHVSNSIFGGFIPSLTPFAFSADERLLATGCFLRTLVLWPLDQAQ